jgi:hypothetical protein
LPKITSTSGRLLLALLAFAAQPVKAAPTPPGGAEAVPDIGLFFQAASLERERAAPHPDDALFEAALYGQIDPRFAEFFPADAPPPLVRLDAVDWGGVGVDGIPPLDHPAHVEASEASWLDDDHVVFGIALGGEARAYPKRILAWHELARDRLGDVELAIDYCTLCGTVIP